MERVRELADKKLQLLNIPLSICSFQLCTFVFEIGAQHLVFRSPTCLWRPAKLGRGGWWLPSAGQWNVECAGGHFRSGPSRAPCALGPSPPPPPPDPLAGR